MGSLRSGSIALFILFALNSSALTVDGIAVSTQTAVLWPTMPGGDIMRYDIRDNDVVAVHKLLEGQGGRNAESRGRFPALNLSATKVAFYHCTNSGDYVAVMNIDGTGLRDLVRIPDGDGYDPNGYLDWPEGDWVYYQRGGGENAVEGNKHLWRVNVNDPQQDELVTSFGYHIWQFGMSSDAGRMFLRLCCGDKPTEIAEYTLPSSGPVTSSMSIDYGVGCAVALSPSGQWLTYNMGGSHVYMIVRSWDESGESFDFSSYPDINGWAVNSSEFMTHCPWHEYPEGVDISLGMGADCNRWSSNSDKWLSLRMGWLEDAGASGRDGFCGANQVVANWQDGIAVNCSKNPRACADNGQFWDSCDKNAPASEWRKNDAGDFIVTAPATDINEDLRQFITAAADAPPRSGMSGGPIAHRVVGGVLSVGLGAEGVHHIGLVDAAGREVWAGRAQRMCPVPCHRFAPGVYVLTIQRAGHRISKSIAIAPH